MAIGASASTRDEVIDQLVALHVAADPGPGFLRLSMREAEASSSQAPALLGKISLRSVTFARRARARGRTLPKRALLACILR